MGFTWLLATGVHPRVPSNSSIGSIDTRKSSSLTGIESRTSRDSKSARKSKRKGRRSTNLKAASALMKQLNQETFMENDFYKLFARPEKRCQLLEDGYNFSTSQVVCNHRMMRDSFPDWKYTYESIKEPQPGCIVIEGVVCSGTNTGKPFAPSPRFSPREATGKHVVNDEERFCLEMKDGQIKTWRVISMGSKTGLVGLYEAIGGTLSSHPNDVMPRSS